MPAEDETFGALVGELDYPMLIVTASDAEEQSGCLVGFATQASIDPPRYAVYLSDKNRTYRVAQRAEYLGVHFVPDDADDLARLFGGETGDEIDKFERCSWEPGPGGVPVLDGVKGWVAGPVVGRFDMGDHVAFLVDAGTGAAEEPSAGELGFQAVKDLEPGHEP